MGVTLGIHKRDYPGCIIKIVEYEKFIDLTVKEIAHAANISRSTFYLYYVNKYDLMLMDDVRRLLNDRFLVKYRSFYNVEFNDANAIRNLSDRLTTQLMQLLMIKTIRFLEAMAPLVT